MTDPVVLLGTQSNGETLPVQVNSLGQLVAEGLQGQEGPPGPDGPPGADGGAFPLPADPFEGALLGWLNGGLAWVNGSIPIPEGVFGPIVSYDPQSGFIEVAGEVPAAVSTGVYVYQCTQEGIYYTPTWNTSVQWSSGGGHLTGGSWGLVFDGNPPTSLDSGKGAYLANNDTTPAIYTFPSTINGELRVWATTAFQAGSSFVSLNNGAMVEVTGATTNPAWYSFGYQSNITSMTLGSPSNTDGLVIGAISVGAELLVNPENSLNLRVTTKLVNGLVGIASSDINFTPGMYLKVPAQRVAPWVLSGVDPTSVIDYLRRE